LACNYHPKGSRPPRRKAELVASYQANHSTFRQVNFATIRQANCTTIRQANCNSISNGQASRATLRHTSICVFSIGAAAAGTQ
jgi:hypothetical protein